jgi:hypothetical protein
VSLAFCATVICGAWAVINGILHDVFVLRSEQGKTYNRDLLRLLMDGHILITCGLIQLLGAKEIEKANGWAYFIATTASISLLVYCAMIWPFLKSVGTIIINIALVSILLWSYFQ